MLKNLSPHALVFFILFFLGGLAVVAPVEIGYFSFSVLWVFLSVALFLIFSLSFSFYFLNNYNVKRLVRPSMTNRLLLVFKICLFLSVIGVLVRFLDLLFLRGIDFSGGLSEARISLQALTYSSDSDIKKAGMLSAIGAVFYGFVFPVTIMLIMFWDEINKKYCYVAVIVAVAPAIESILNAGVMGLGFVLLYTTFGFLYRWCVNGYVVGVRTLLYFSFVCFFVLISGAWFFISRIEVMFGDVGDYFFYNRALILPNENVLSAMDVPFLRELAFGVYWLVSYLLQGIVEFAFLVDNFDENSHLNGSKQFFIVNKFFSILGVVEFSAYEITIANPRPGRYQTVFGDVYMDFGFLGLIFQPVILGVVCAYLYVKRMIGSVSAIILYPFFQASIVMGPLINTFSGSRMYALAACLMVIIMIKFSFSGDDKV